MSKYIGTASTIPRCKCLAVSTVGELNQRYNIPIKEDSNLKVSSYLRNNGLPLTATAIELLERRRKCTCALPESDSDK